jgi:hypothetical protein
MAPIELIWDLRFCMALRITVKTSLLTISYSLIYTQKCRKPDHHSTLPVHTQMTWLMPIFDGVLDSIYNDIWLLFMVVDFILI